METAKVGTRVFSRKYGTGTVIGLKDSSLAVRFDKKNCLLHTCKSLTGKPLCEEGHGYWCLPVENFSKLPLFYDHEVVLLREREVWD